MKSKKQEENYSDKKFREYLERFFEQRKTGKWSLWLPTLNDRGLKVFNQLMKNEYKADLQKRSEIREYLVLDTGEDSSEKSKSSIQED